MGTRCAERQAAEHSSGLSSPREKQSGEGEGVKVITQPFLFIGYR